ncbi:MAG: imidazole glycerol phosphate synthase subunit HisH [Chitinophagales bacterium]
MDVSGSRPVAIVDYGVGNLRSVAKACARAGFAAQPTASPEDVREAPGVILPGVGAFGAAMANLAETGLKAAVEEAIREAMGGGRPFLGLCLGLHLLFAESEEAFGGERPKGLGLFPGKVVRFPAGLKVPQIGWNTVRFAKPHPLLDGLREGSYFYFIHSYHVMPADPALALLTTDYGGEFVSAAAVGNAAGVQFHPEKSSSAGLKLLGNFGRMVHGG